MAGGIMLAGESCERAASVRFHIQRNPAPARRRFSTGSLWIWNLTLATLLEGCELYVFRCVFIKIILSNYGTYFIVNLWETKEPQGGLPSR